MATKKLSFEQSLSRLDEIVRHLEMGDLSLDDSLKLFSEGTELISRCSQLLDDARQTVVKVRKGTDGEAVEQPFEEDEK